LQHPLSVSSSGESDDEDSDKDAEKEKEKKQNVDPVDKDVVVKRIVELLDNEEEEQVRDVLKPFMGEFAKVSHCLGVCSSYSAPQAQLLTRRTMPSWIRYAWIVCTDDEVSHDFSHTPHLLETYWQTTSKVHLMHLI
jgi:hypothetical protein